MKKLIGVEFSSLFANAKGFVKVKRFSYVRKSLVLYCVEEAPEKEHFLRIMANAINDF
jgi:hypothetical protein